MIVSKIIEYDDDSEVILKLFEFRYEVYIEELDYLKPKTENYSIKKEFDEYDQYAKHIILEDDSEIIACARIVPDSEIGLPVLNKAGYSCMFDSQKKVEVSRLIVKKEYRKSHVFICLIHSVFKCLLSMNCTYVLADTFKDAETYKILKSLGFQDLNLEYTDASFNLCVKSVVLYFKMNEMLDSLRNCPNKKQMAFLKNLDYKIS